MGTYVMAANPTTKVLAMHSLLSSCVNIMGTYVMVPNSMTKFSEDIFPSIDLCQHNIMGPDESSGNVFPAIELCQHYGDICDGTKFNDKIF
jgi:hypothetical protein